jgi:hypothetical protein
MGVRTVGMLVPLAVGHDLVCLLWNSSYMGSQLTFIQPCYYKHAYKLFTMNAYGGGGCLCAAFATDSLWGGGCLCAHVLLRYLLVNIGPKLSLKWPSNSSTTNWHQPGVCLSIVFPHTFLGRGVWGASIPTHTSHLGH